MRPYAGISKEVLKWPARVRAAIAGLRKVPAHVEVGACLTNGARRDAQGNNAADVAAKTALSAHPQWDTGVASIFERDFADARATAKLIARAGPLWPAAQPPGRRRLVLAERRPVEGCANLPTIALKNRAAKRRAGTHTWAAVMGAATVRALWGHAVACGAGH